MRSDPGDSTEKLFQLRPAHIAAAAIMLVISGFSLLPMRLKVALGFDRNLVAHLASHLIAFAILAAALRFAVRRDHAWRALGIAAVVGVALEVLEHVVYGAPLESRDMALDFAAACVGTALATLMQQTVWATPRGNG